MEKKYGYLRETKQQADKQNENYPNNKIGWTCLLDYLIEIFPEVNDWVEDETIPKNLQQKIGKCYKYRPDFRSEKLKMVIEFDGLQHYNNPYNVYKDKIRDENIKKLGYEVVRIPYFIQLTRTVIKEMFGVDMDHEMFPEGIPSFEFNKDNFADDGCPSYLCKKGLQRMAEDFAKYPSQYDVNINFLKKMDPSNLTSEWKDLEKYYYEICQENNSLTK